MPLYSGCFDCRAETEDGAEAGASLEMLSEKEQPCTALAAVDDKIPDKQLQGGRFILAPGLKVQFITAGCHDVRVVSKQEHETAHSHLHESRKRGQAINHKAHLLRVTRFLQVDPTFQSFHRFPERPIV